MADEYGKDDKDILIEATSRFKYCMDREGDARERALDDLRFAMGDAENLYQWPQWAADQRQRDKRPCLTINKIPQYLRQITNDARQNKPAIKVHPVEDGDVEVAQALQGICRSIEYHSQADTAYITALESAAATGCGYWRILTDYVDDKSFDQEIRIVRIRNRFSVYLDPDRQMPDGSDAKYGFIVEELTDEEFRKAYPDIDPGSWSADGPWYSNGTEGKLYRVAEYFHYEITEKTLLQFSDGASFYLEDVPKEMMSQVPPVLRQRKVEVKKVRWCKLTDGHVLESSEWPGKYIPIVEVVGEEWDTGEEIERVGIVRRARDPQRMYNFWQTAITEKIALAPKSPWLMAEGQDEGYEEMWKNANNEAQSRLVYKPTALNGQPLPPPQRNMPAPMEPGMVQQTQAAEHDLQSVIGIYKTALGDQGNERSGRAIMARMREADTSTFHYMDNLSKSIAHTGRILIDLIVKVYDTRRVVRIIGEDDVIGTATLDPNIPMASMGNIFNPNIGRYDVTVTTGPSYTTKRQESADAMMGVINAYPPIMQVAGDLLVKAMDWAGADKISERMKAILPPQLQALDDDRNSKTGAAVKAIQAQYQQQMQLIQQQAQQVISQLGERLQKAEQAAQGKEAEIAKITGELKQAQIDAEAKITEALIERDAKIYETNGKIREAELAAMGRNEDEGREASEKPAVVVQYEAGEGLSNDMRALVAVLASQAQDQAAATQQAIAASLSSMQQAISAMREEKPERKVMRITAPSGAVYEGTIVES